MDTLLATARSSVAFSLLGRKNMHNAANAITRLYNLTGTAFDQQLLIITTNMRHTLLRELCDTSATSKIDRETFTQYLINIAIKSHVQSSESATITPDQKQDFQLHLDRDLAATILIIEHCLVDHPELASVDFQLAAVAALGIPAVD